MNCLDKVIKLSRTECSCFDENKPVNYNEGQSEVYLDELEGLNLSLTDSASDCEQGNVWDLMVKARENATLNLKADLLAIMQDDLQAKRQNYNGLIGQTSATSTLNITEAQAGMKLTPHYPIVGGKVKIKRIGVFMNTSTAVTVSVYSSDPDVIGPIATYTINSIANTVTFAILSTPLELPLWSKNVTLLNYYFVYNISGFQPKNNKTQCVPCSGGAKNVIWNNWVLAYGIKGTGGSYANYASSNELNGLILDLELFCESARIICSEEYPLNFENDGKALQIAYAIRYKSGALLIDSILSSPEINRYTMMDREALYGKRNYYRAEYEKRIEFLSKNVPIINSDCWMCKPSSQFRRGNILS